MADDAPGSLDAAAPAYPAHWEADVVLRDGAAAHLRPIRPGDEARLERFHGRQSPESIYFRFFAVVPRLSAADLHRFTHVDHVDRVAFVVTIGDEIVGIGRYDRIGDAAAEVAFNVADAHQGRGLGSVLLEHLAAAARENRIRRFTADVLPHNRKMLAVFREAGYEVRHRLEDGVLSLRFDIDPTERSLAVMEAREHRAEATSVQALLNPSSVALFGASRRAGTVGHQLLATLLEGGFRGRLHLVHPEADEILGVPARRRLADVGGPVDLAVVAVPAESVPGVVRECVGHQVRGLLVVSSGFAETGPDGAARQRELVRLARANGLRVVGPNCWGIINADPAVRLNASLTPSLPASGRLGLLCQSGAVSASVLDLAELRGLGLSTFLSSGNRSDVSGNDCLQYWEEDPQTHVIGIYLESMGNPRKFSRIARRLSRVKPVIVVKSGVSGFAVPPGHDVRPTRAPREAFDQMLRQSGCIRVDSVPHLLDVAQLLLHQPLPAGHRVAVVANSHALAAMIADACVGSGLEVVDQPHALPPQSAAEAYAALLADAVSDERVDSVVAGLIPPLTDAAADALAGIAHSERRGAIPVLACVLGRRGVGSRETVSGGVPAYALPEDAVRALAAATWLGAWRRRDVGTRVDPSGCDPAGAREMVVSWLDGAAAAGAGGGRAGRTDRQVPLNREQAAGLLARYGIDLWPAVPVSGPEHAVEIAERVGWPVALKTLAPQFVHRVDLGGVRLDIADAAELRADVEQLQHRLAGAGEAPLVVQRMAPPGVACVVRSVEDPLFGPVVSFGLSGDASDLLGDVGHRIAPLTDVDVGELVRSVRAAPKLFGHRGARPADVAALEDVVARVSRLADDLPEIAELELNPVVVGERGAAVLGAVVRIAPDPHRRDYGRRELHTG